MFISQFVISSDGVVGLCYEHSPAEGIAVLNLIDDFLGKLKQEASPRSGDNETTALAETSTEGEATGTLGDKGPEPIPQPIKLEWSVSTESRNALRESCVEIDR